MTVLKAFRLEKTLVNRLSKIAKASHRSEKYYVQEALRFYLEEMEDARIAHERMQGSKPADFLDAQEFKKKTGLK